MRIKVGHFKQTFAVGGSTNLKIHMLCNLISLLVHDLSEYRDSHGFTKELVITSLLIHRHGSRPICKSGMMLSDVF